MKDSLYQKFGLSTLKYDFLEVKCCQPGNVAELKKFVTEHKREFAWCVYSDSDSSNSLPHGTWFFCDDRASLMKTFCTYHKKETYARFLNFSEELPEEADFFFADKERFWKGILAERQLTMKEEETRIYYLPENYKGWWLLENLPDCVSCWQEMGYYNNTFFDNHDLSKSTVEYMLFEKMFVDIFESGAYGEDALLYSGYEDILDYVEYLANSQSTD